MYFANVFKYDRSERYLIPTVRGILLCEHALPGLFLYLFFSFFL